MLVARTLLRGLPWFILHRVRLTGFLVLLWLIRLVLLCHRILLMSARASSCGATMLMKDTTACAKSKLPTDSTRVSATSFIIAHKVKSLRKPRLQTKRKYFH